MTKSELVTQMAIRAGLSKVDADKALTALLAALTDDLKIGGKTTLQGLGTFSVGTRAARAGINPQTGEPVQIPAGKTPKLKASSTLKAALN